MIRRQVTPDFQELCLAHTLQHFVMGIEPGSSISGLLREKDALMSHASRPPTPDKFPSRSYFDLLKEKYAEPEGPAAVPARPENGAFESAATPAPRPPAQAGLDLGSKSLLAVTLLLLLTTAGLTLTLKPSIPRSPLLTAPPAKASIAEVRADERALEKPGAFESSRISSSARPELTGVRERAETAESGRVSPQPEAEVEMPVRVSEPIATEAATRPASAEGRQEVGRTAYRDGRSMAQPRTEEAPGRTAFAPQPPDLENARRIGAGRAVPVDGRAEIAGVATGEAVPRPRPQAEERRVADQPLEPPGRLVSPLPGYTSAAWVAGVQGDVLLRASIDERGTVTGVEVVQGLPHGLTEAAVAAVRRWRFRPATRAGEPVAVDHDLSIRFAL